jgi:ureidoglycolate hydrolase
MIKDTYLEITEHLSEGYQPCVDFGDWRVAILRFIGDVKAENITYLERHNQTDEVFVLLEGRCVLFIGEGREDIDNIRAVEMSPQKMYNVKKGAYHNHALSQDAVVLIVENRDTGDANSEKTNLSAAQRQEVVRLANSFLGAKA